MQLVEFFLVPLVYPTDKISQPSVCPTGVLLLPVIGNMLINNYINRFC